MDNKMEASNNASSATAGAGTTMPARLGGPMSWMASCLACCTVDTYKSYFDLDTDDVKNRVKAAILTFYKADYFRNEVLGVGPRTETLKGPDLYGPFWITMTLIFLVAVRFLCYCGCPTHTVSFGLTDAPLFVFPRFVLFRNSYMNRSFPI